MANEYQSRINSLIASIDTTLVDFSYKLKYDENERVPTQAFGEFLTNREQGDWAEKSIIKAINNTYDDIVAVQYGKNENIIAGDPGFKSFYKEYKKELVTIGKRPDVLIFSKDIYEKYKGIDFTSLSVEEQLEIIPLALAGLEVRSSAYLESEYIPKDDRPSLTFTPKVEDFLVVKKWIDTFGVPHYYVQVFFDGAFILSYENILEIMSTSQTKGRSSKKYYLEDDLSFLVDRAPKNQFKTTLNFFLPMGEKITNACTFPVLSAKSKKLAGGRILNYITFEESNIELNENLRSYLNI